MKVILLALALTAAAAIEFPPSCQKPLYCNSKLLHHVQMSRIFPDSKSFVDLHLKFDDKTILSSFDVLLNKTKNNPSKDDLIKFVNDNFDLVEELESWKPADFNANPSFLGKIKDINLRQFGELINNLWPVLGRKVSPIVQQNPESFSLIPVQNGFIIPGGNFKEFYYWDTYWIIEGLLVSGMKDTVKGILSNLIDLQRTFGHIPNGGRWYFQERSQPPLLSAMMKLYLEATHDVKFLKDNIDILESELQYWLDTQSVVFKKGNSEHTLLRYYTPSEGPRPEKYYEDYTRAQIFDSEERQKQFYTDIKSAAESGWDFSSRWFINEDGSNIGNLTSVHASEIVPVDLNAIFTNSLQNMAYFYGLLHNSRKGAHWAHIAKQWRNSIKDVLWNENDGIWYDFDLSHDQHRKYFYPSNIAPLWMDVVDKAFVKDKAQHIIQYMNQTHSLQFPGGVPTSLIRSGERWDFPNAWPPLVSIVVKSLEALGTKESAKLAFEVAQTWVRSSYKGYLTSKQLFDKYDVESPGKVGGEGEYAVQAGFGWTNGAILEMLAKYGQQLTVQDGFYNFNEYKKEPVFWHIPTAAHLSPNYKLASPHAAPVLINSHVPKPAIPQHVHDQPILVPSKPVQPAHIPSVPVQPVPQIPVKPGQIPSSSVQPGQVPSISVQPPHVQHIPGKPENINSASVQQGHVPSIPVQPTPVPQIPVKPEYVNSGSVQQVQPTLVPQVTVQPKSLYSVSENIPSVLPTQESHFNVQSDYIQSVSVQNGNVPSSQVKPGQIASVKPEQVPSLPVPQGQLPSAPIKPADQYELGLYATEKNLLSYSTEKPGIVPVTAEHGQGIIISAQPTYLPSVSHEQVSLSNQHHEVEGSSSLQASLPLAASTEGTYSPQLSLTPPKASISGSVLSAGGYATLPSQAGYLGASHSQGSQVGAGISGSVAGSLEGSLPHAEAGISGSVPSIGGNVAGSVEGSLPHAETGISGSLPSAGGYASLPSPTGFLGASLSQGAQAGQVGAGISASVPSIEGNAAITSPSGYLGASLSQGAQAGQVGAGISGSIEGSAAVPTPSGYLGASLSQGAQAGQVDAGISGSIGGSAAVPTPSGYLGASFSQGAQAGQVDAGISGSIGGSAAVPAPTGYLGASLTQGAQVGQVGAGISGSIGGNAALAAQTGYLGASLSQGAQSGQIGAGISASGYAAVPSPAGQLGASLQGSQTGQIGAGISQGAQASASLGFQKPSFGVSSSFF